MLLHIMPVMASATSGMPVGIGGVPRPVRTWKGAPTSMGAPRRSGGSSPASSSSPAVAWQSAAAEPGAADDDRDVQRRKFQAQPLLHVALHEGRVVAGLASWSTRLMKTMMRSLCRPLRSRIMAMSAADSGCRAEITNT